MTRFDGDPVRTVPTARDYFSADLVAAVEARRGDFDDLEDKWPPVNVFPPLLLAIGLW